MRLLADENFPGRAVDALREAGHDVVWVRSAAPRTRDIDLLAWAAREGRVLLTFDKDFGEIGAIYRICRSRTAWCFFASSCHRATLVSGSPRLSCHGTIGSAISRSLNHVVSACVRCRSRHPSEAANSHLP